MKFVRLFFLVCHMLSYVSISAAKHYQNRILRVMYRNAFVDVLNRSICVKSEQASLSQHLRSPGKSNIDNTRAFSTITHMASGTSKRKSKLYSLFASDNYIFDMYHLCVYATCM